MRRRLLLLAGAGVLPVCAGAAPPSPGAIGDTVKQPPTLQPPAATPQINAQQPQAPAGPAQGATITVTRFTFTGNTLFGADVLEPLVKDYLNRPITLAQLYQAADEVADFYVKKGYALASVNVPAQKIKDGTVRLEVIEGRIGKISFDGIKRYREDILRGFMSETQPKQVYRAEPLSDDLQRLNALPGLATRAVIQPGAEYGTSDVVVKTQEDPIDGYVVMDNYGRKDTGEYRLSASVTLNNPLRAADQLQIMGVHSTNDGLNYGYVDYNVPMDFSGLRLDMNYGHAYFKATGVIPVSGQNDNLEVNVIKPWQRTPTDSLSTSAGYLHTKGNADLTGAPNLSHTNINLLNISATLSHTWQNAAVTQFVYDIHTNFRAPAAGENNREWMRLEVNAIHLQPLPAHLQLLAVADALYSPSHLADTEQMSVGGPTSVRGFPTSEARGDRGFFGQLTLRRPFSMGPVALVPRLYGDTGLVIALPPPGVPTTRTHNSLSSVGTGFDVIYHTIDLKVDFTYPLDSTPVSDGRDDGRVYASLTAGF